MEAWAAGKFRRERVRERAAERREEVEGAADGADEEGKSADQFGGGRGHGRAERTGGSGGGSVGVHPIRATRPAVADNGKQHGILGESPERGRIVSLVDAAEGL